MFLVQAKRQSLKQSLVYHIPEAVSQAIALLKSEKYVGAFPSLFHLNIAIQLSGGPLLSI